MKGKRRVRENDSEKEEKETKWVEIQEKEEQLMVNSNEAKIMNEENCIETTKMRKNLKKLVKNYTDFKKGLSN